MKDLVKILLICLFLPTAVLAQAHLSICGLQDFPEVAIAGQPYSFSGFVKNTGDSSTPAVLDVVMQVNGNTNITLINHLPVGSSFHPGDSIPWVVNGFVFQTTYMRPNNNDILIWPTGPGNNQMEIDTLPRTVFYTNRAAFRTNRSMVDIGAESFSPEFPHYLFLQAVNEGAGWNAETVKIYASFSPGQKILLDEIGENYMPGDTINYRYPFSFVLSEFVARYATSRNAPMPRVIKFWAQEVAEVDPIEIAEVGVNTIITGLDELVTTEYSIAGNPVASHLVLAAGPEMLSRISQVNIYDLEGQQLHTQAGYDTPIAVSNLPAGVYFVHIMAGEKFQTLKFIRQ